MGRGGVRWHATVGAETGKVSAPNIVITCVVTVVTSFLIVIIGWKWGGVG